MTHFALALFLLLPLVADRASAHQEASGLTPEQAYGMALEEQTARRYARVLPLLRDAAGRGHVEAQEMLGAVLVGSAHLYGVPTAGGRCEAHQWFLRAARNGSDVGAFFVHLLNQTRNSPAGARCDTALHERRQAAGGELPRHPRVHPSSSRRNPPP